MSDYSPTAELNKFLTQTCDRIQNKFTLKREFVDRMNPATHAVERIETLSIRHSDTGMYLGSIAGGELILGTDHRYTVRRSFHGIKDAERYVVFYLECLAKEIHREAIIKYEEPSNLILEQYPKPLVTPVPSWLKDQ